MNRRDLLKGLFGASAAAVVPLPFLLSDKADYDEPITETTTTPGTFNAIPGRYALISATFSADHPRPHYTERVGHVTCRAVRESGEVLLQFALWPDGGITRWVAMPGCEILARPGNSIYLEWDDTPCNIIAEAVTRTRDGDLVSIHSESSGNSWRVPAHSPSPSR